MAGPEQFEIKRRLSYEHVPFDTTLLQCRANQIRLRFVANEDDRLLVIRIELSNLFNIYAIKTRESLRGVY